METMMKILSVLAWLGVVGVAAMIALAWAAARAHYRSMKRELDSLLREVEEAQARYLRVRKEVYEDSRYAHVLKNIREVGKKKYEKMVEDKLSQVKK